jgi:hypothetical protein
MVMPARALALVPPAQRPVEQQIKYRITTDREEPTSWVSHAAWPQIKMQEHKTAKMAQAKSSNPRYAAPCSVNYHSQCLQGRHLADVGSEHMVALARNSARQYW